ncbi:MAG: SGNH/GDSL hydrolase family protein [Pirellulales bacterium]
MRQQTVAASLAVPLFLVASGAAFAVQIGVMGDSLSDEYFEQTYGSYADNWTEQFVTYRGVDMGPLGAWGEPRRNGYEYNWARSGATTTSLLSTGQHTGLAGQVVPEGIDYAVLMIGPNDQHALSNMYSNLYSGAWTPGDANTITWVKTVATNIDTAVTTVKATGVPLLLATSMDFGVTPLVNQSLAPIASQRQAVTNVLANQLTPAIQAIAQAHDLPLIDIFGMMNAIVGTPLSLNSTVTIGNFNINLQQVDTITGTVPTAGFVDDGIHPHTTLQGVIANLVMEGLNIGYGANLSLFSETEILAHRGISYGGSDTLEAQIGPYSDYVLNYVPEPSSLALATLAAVALPIVTLRRRSLSVAPTAFRGVA